MSEIKSIKNTVEASFLSHIQNNIFQRFSWETSEKVEFAKELAWENDPNSYNEENSLLC